MSVNEKTSLLPYLAAFATDLAVEMPDFGAKTMNFAGSGAIHLGSAADLVRSSGKKAEIL
jgi:hypothetical protein